MNAVDLSRACLIVIPARSESTRLPRKLLLRETGKSVLHHTYEQAQTSRLAGRIVIAAGDEAIATEAHRFGASCVMTDPHARSGTDRVAEVARQMSEHEIVINLQGDEPELPGEAIDLAAQLLHDHPDASVATLAAPIERPETVGDPACVKVVFNHAGQALYFSRSPIPYVRDQPGRCWSDGRPRYHQHVGLYAFRRDFLLRLNELPVSPLEASESLEQLRFLEAGETIQVGLIGVATPGIDTIDDYLGFVARMRAKRGGGGRVKPPLPGQSMFVE